MGGENHYPVILPAQVVPVREFPKRLDSTKWAVTSWPWLLAVYRGWHTTQLCREYCIIIGHETRIPESTNQDDSWNVNRVKLHRWCLLIRSFHENLDDFGYRFIWGSLAFFVKKKKRMKVCWWPLPLFFRKKRSWVPLVLNLLKKKRWKLKLASEKTPNKNCLQPFPSKSCGYGSSRRGGDVTPGHRPKKTTRKPALFEKKIGPLKSILKVFWNCFDYMKNNGKLLF